MNNVDYFMNTLLYSLVLAICDFA